MEVQQDFRDLFELFNKHEVEYIVVGAYAPGFHGAPPYTGDLDLLVKPDPANSKTLMKALDEFGFGSVGLAEADFEKEGMVVQLGFPPVRIDLMTSITGVSWEKARSGRGDGWFGDLIGHYLGRDEFISNKRALGRKKDLADPEAVGEE